VPIFTLSGVAKISPIRNTMGTRDRW